MASDRGGKGATASQAFTEMIQVKQCLTFKKLDLDRHPHLLVQRRKKNSKKKEERHK